MSDGLYFNWLCRKIGVNPGGNHSEFGRLAEALANKSFTVASGKTVENDINRALDGIDLRSQYMDISGGKVPNLSKPCTVLEMMIAFARRIDQDVMGNDSEDKTAKWFWEMIDNLGLSNEEDEDFDTKKVDEILDIWLDRKFDKNGNGSPFPLDNSASKDQRKVEMWYQMQEYTCLNYPD